MPECQIGVGKREILKVKIGIIELDKIYLSFGTYGRMNRSSLSSSMFLIIRLPVEYGFRARK